MASAHKRGNNYQLIVSCGYDQNGKKIVKTNTWTPPIGMTEKQILRELERQKIHFEEQVKNGNFTDGTKIKLSDFCMEYLIIVKSTLAATTWRSYKNTIEQQIIPELGHIKLSDLRPMHVQRFIQKLEEKGRFEDLHYQQSLEKAEKAKASGKTLPPMPIKKEYLSPATIKRIHAVLQSVLGRAMKLGLILSNPADSEKIDLPHIEIPNTEILDEEAAKIVLSALETEPLIILTLKRVW